MQVLNLQGPAGVVSIAVYGIHMRKFIDEARCNPFRVDGVVVRLTQGSSFLATLIGVPKLFTVGEESPRQLSPQPIVNNFARRARPFCEQACRRPKRLAVTPRWMTNMPPGSLDELAQSFAPARRLDSKRILRCRQCDDSTIRPSLSPSQRARNIKCTQS